MQIEIPKDIENLLLAVCKQKHAKPNKVILEALQTYLEDQYDYFVGVEAYNDYLKSGKKTYSLEEVKKELKL